jgi:predicted transposase/invertase (TIGR01784 family)
LLWGIILAETYFNDSDDLIDIRYDVMFKAVFARDTPVSQQALSKLVSALIGRKVTVLTLKANEPPVDNIRDRQIRFDINCKTEDGELINVEMSFNPKPFEPVRLEYHAGKLFSGQDIKGDGKTYNHLKQTYQIAILGMNKFFQDEAILHTFEYFDKEHGVSLNGRTRIIALELSKMDKIIEKPIGEMNAVEHWGVFFQYLTDMRQRRKINEIIVCEEGIAMASEILMTISKDEAEKARLRSELKYQLDLQSDMAYEREQGIQQGLQQGLQQGIQEGKLAIARNMVKRNRPIDEIIEDTGLTREEMEKL